MENAPKLKSDQDPNYFDLRPIALQISRRVIQAEDEILRSLVHFRVPAPCTFLRELADRLERSYEEAEDMSPDEVKVAPEPGPVVVLVREPEPEPEPDPEPTPEPVSQERTVPGGFAVPGPTPEPPRGPRVMIPSPIPIPAPRPIKAPPAPPRPRGRPPGPRKGAAPKPPRDPETIIPDPPPDPSPARLSWAAQVRELLGRRPFSSAAIAEKLGIKNPEDQHWLFRFLEERVTAGELRSSRLDSSRYELVR